MKIYSINFRKFYITIIIIFTYWMIGSSATYAFTGSGNWNDPALWTPTIPPNIQQPNDTILINGFCTYNFPGFSIGSSTILIINNGKQLNIQQSPLINDGNIYNHGTLLIYQNRTLENNGSLYNYFKLQFNNYSIFENDGELNNSGDVITGSNVTITNNDIINNNGKVSIATNTTLTNNSNFTNNDYLVLDQSAVLTNYGTIHNEVNSEIYNLGIVNIHGTLTNDGTFRNNINLIIHTSGTFNNNVTFLNIDYATLNNYGVFNNLMPINNFGIINNYGVFNNNSTIENKSYSSCQIINHLDGTFNNEVALINNYNRPLINHGTLINNGSISNSGTITNNGTFNSHGTVTTMLVSFFITNGTMNNYGTFTNNWNSTNNGTIINHGNIVNQKNFINNGTFSSSSTVQNSLNATFTNNIYKTLNNNSGGTFSNIGTINNNGIINNNTGADLINNNGGFLNNFGTINNHGTLEVNGSLISYVTINNSGILNVNNTLTCQDGGYVFNNINGTIIINQNGTMNIDDTIVNNDGTITNNFGGTVYISYSNFTNNSLIQNHGIWTNTIIGKFDNNGTLINQAGGVLNSNNRLNNYVSGILNNDGSLTFGSDLLNDGIVNNNNIMVINAQVFNYSGSIYNNANGNIKGVGRIIQFNVFENNSLSSISPGLSPGGLQGAGNISLGEATLHCEIHGTVQGTTYDWLSVEGTVNINQNSKLSVDWGNFMPSNGDVYTIITANLVAGSFLVSNIDIPPINNLNFIVGYTSTTVTISVFDPLPIKLTNFYGEPQGEDVKLTWQTQNEINNQGFEILRSIDSKSWFNIGYISGFGSSQTIQNYTYIDENPVNGISFYRLNQIDFDGKSELSNIIRVSMIEEAKIQIYPIPTQTIVNIKGISVETEYTIIRTNGQLVQSGQIYPDANINVQNLTNGIYFLKINNQMLEFVKN